MQPQKDPTIPSVGNLLVACPFSHTSANLPIRIQTRNKTSKKHTL
jgi:hypothetical protein